MTEPQADPKYEAALPGKPWAARRHALLHLFENIEPRYDRLNRYLSLGIDQGWRRWTVRSVATDAQGPWLDLASGTGDLAVLAEEALRRRGEGRRLVRSDLSGLLLGVGLEKLAAMEKRAVQGDPPSLHPGAAAEMDRLPFASGSVAAVLQGFALRHCEDFTGFFAELLRILEPGGQVAILDMRYPREGLGSGLYRLYFRRVLPRLAGLLGADRAAYEFMVDSVISLPEEPVLIRALETVGFERAESRPGFLGAVRLLVAWKPAQRLDEGSPSDRPIGG